MESKGVHVKGFIVREKNNDPNNFRCEMDLDTYLKQNKVIGLEGIDTRALTKILRNNGTMKGIITLENATLEDIQQKLDKFSNTEAVRTVTRKEKEYIKGNCQNNDYIIKYQKLGDNTNFFFKKTIYRVKKNG